MKQRFIRSSAMAFALAGMASGAFAQDMIRIASANKVTTLDPIASAAAGNIEAFGQLYARLLRKDADGTLLPGLATEWSVSEDGLTYTFELRDAKFSDGTDITAEDVAFSLMRAAKDEELSYPAAYAPVKEVVAIDEDTVELRLEHPSAPMLAYMEIFNAGIVSKDDDNARTTMIMAGEIDVSRGVPWSQIEEVNNTGIARVALEPSTIVYGVMPNHGKPPFDNLNIRKAAAMALHREAITQAVSLGNATVANSTLPNALTFYADDVAPPAYDAAGARALLEQEDAVGTEITLMITPSGEQVATLLKAQWVRLGSKPMSSAWMVACGGPV